MQIICRNKYHADCVKIGQDVPRSKWLCSPCMSGQSDAACSVSPPNKNIQISDEFQSPINTESMSFDRIQEILNNTLDIKIRELRESLQDVLRKEIFGEIERLKQDFTATTDLLQNEQLELKTSIKNINKSIHTLELGVIEMQNEVAFLKKKINDSDKLTRSQNIEIQSVPERKNENLVKIFTKLCQTVSVSINDSDIVSCRRVAKMDSKSTRPRNIIVTLPSPRHRDNLISAVKRYNNTHPQDLLCSSLLGIVGESSRVYVNETFVSRTEVIICRNSCV
ncbi:unnamed protein product [Colias eurytheme]|nr:unnamed protein product [Colias eurytheme]